MPIDLMTGNGYEQPSFFNCPGIIGQVIHLQVGLSINLSLRQNPY